MSKKNRLFAWLAILISLHSLFFVVAGFAQQVIQAEKNEITQEGEIQDKITPGPQNIKESAGIFVFVAWMWLAIFVLIYVLRLKVKEVDRLFEIRYLSGKKK
ncbi:MAG: hypothetical protein PVI11_05375 [Candidatus Aminicenantes bacterium]|jgi:ABC-type Fe3+ transport system permease subunit